MEGRNDHKTETKELLKIGAIVIGILLLECLIQYLLTRN
jgi:hypothetical protein